MWVDDKHEFDKRFPGARPLNMRILLSGFGGPVDVNDISKYSELYCIPLFCLTDNKECLMYKNLIVALQKRNENYQMILSYPMLSGLRYLFTPVSKDITTFSIDHPPGFVNFKQYIVENSDIPYIESIQVCTQTEVERLFREENTINSTLYANTGKPFFNK